MDKVLIVEPKKEDRLVLEEILSGEVEELLFAEKKASAICLIEQESPQLVFLDDSVVGDDEEVWIQEGMMTVLMSSHKTRGDKIQEVLSKPLHKNKVLAFTERVFGHPLKPPSHPFPM